MDLNGRKITGQLVASSWLVVAIYPKHVSVGEWANGENGASAASKNYTMLPETTDGYGLDFGLAIELLCVCICLCVKEAEPIEPACVIQFQGGGEDGE